MPDFEREINSIIYDGLIEDISTCFVVTLQTQVEEGETPVKTYRLNIAKYNPENQIPFSSKDDVSAYLATKRDNIFGPWFDDPVEEDDGE